jgi:hypothetical protein
MLQGSWQEKECENFFSLKQIHWFVSLKRLTKYKVLLFLEIIHSLTSYVLALENGWLQTLSCTTWFILVSGAVHIRDIILKLYQT